MPGRDGRGPLGEGPMTGRGFGTCEIDSRENPVETGFFKGLGRGRGRGRGFGRVNGVRFGKGAGFGGRGYGVSSEIGVKELIENVEKRLDAIEKILEAGDRA